MPLRTNDIAYYWTSYMYPGGLYLTSEGWNKPAGYYPSSKFTFPTKTIQCMDFRPWHSKVSVWNNRIFANYKIGNLQFNAAFLDGHAAVVKTGEFSCNPLDSMIATYAPESRRHIK
jgi:prepilin-type processing-associated H-X9-DG protein